MSGLSQVPSVVLGVLLGLGVLVAPRPRKGADGRVGVGGRGASEESLGPEVRVDDAADALLLLSAALRSGCGLVEALEAVARLDGLPAGPHLGVVAAALRWGLPPEAAWGRLDPVWQPAALFWEAAERNGVPPATLLASAAERMRVHEARRLEGALQRAGVHLVLPLGLCFLPAFVATTVVPVVARLAGGLLTGG